MIDPISLAAVTAAVTLLAAECVKGAASAAGKDAWSKIKSLFGWTAEPAARDVARAVAERLQRDESLIQQVVRLLPDEDSGFPVGGLVGSVQATKSVVAGKIETQEFRM